MQINTQLLKALRAEINSALAGVAKKHGLTIEAGNASFSADSFHFKLEGRVLGARPETETVYEMYRQLRNLPPLGTEIAIGREVFIIKGMNPRAHKNNIMIERKIDGKGFVCGEAQVRLATGAATPAIGTAPVIEQAPAMSLADFTKAVNDLSRAQVARINADPNKVFGAMHHDLSESWLDPYHKRGLTPAQALKEMEREAKRELAAEARMS